MNRFGTGLIAGLLAAVLLLATVTPLRDLVLPERLDRTERAIEAIESAYFEEVDGEELGEASLRGIVRELRREHDDRFSHFFDRQAYELIRQAISGELSGIGLQVIEVPRGLRVTRVFEGSPAEEAGLGIDDRIVEVEGESIAGEPADAVTARIRGEPGTEVALAVVEADGGERRELEIERARVRIPAVEAEMRRARGEPVAYVELREFSFGAHGELRERIEELDREGARGLVLDLRANGGGPLEEAVRVASLFVPDGPIVTVEGRARPSRTFEASGEPLAARPTVVLTDRGTASAAEIVVAALRQNDLATLVGTRTFGKGTVQEDIALGDGSAIRLTVAQYLTTDGSSIADTGIRPDVRVRDDDPTDGDDVLRRGLRVVGGDLAIQG